MLTPRRQHDGLRKYHRSRHLHSCGNERSCDSEAENASLLLAGSSGQRGLLTIPTVDTKGSRLIRSQSLPLEGWYQTKYILEVSDLPQNAEDLAEVHFDGNNKITCCTKTKAMGDDAITDVKEDTSDVKVATVMDAVVASDANVMDSSRCVDTNAPPTLNASVSHSSSIPPNFLPSGKLLSCGRRREMEDTVSIVSPFIDPSCCIIGECNTGNESTGRELQSNLHFFGVYDGHGGSQASTFCMDRLHHLVGEEFAKIFNAGGYSAIESDQEWNTLWDQVMKAAFLKADKEVGGICPNKSYDNEGEDLLDNGCLCCADAVAPENVGTTAVVAVVGSCHIVVANCGDSRAVLARGNTAIPLSRDHKPEDNEEMSRIEAAGGRVICWDGYRVGGLLALSRAIGDRYLKRYVISEPEVTCIQCMPDDECLILASDGLWDVINNDFACEVTRKSLAALRKKYKSRPSPPGKDPAAAAAAALLVKLAYGRGSKDNISVVVVDLKCR